MNKQIKVHNNSFGFYEDHPHYNLNDAITFANNAALYQYEENEKEYTEALKKYNSLKEYLADKPEEIKFLNEPKKPGNFKIEVMIRYAETEDDWKYRNLYSISRNKIREMKQYGLISLPYEWEPY